MALRPVRDSETAITLLHKTAYKKGRITSAAFYTKSRVPSLFVKELLPGQDGSVLQIGDFERHGRATLPVEWLRSAVQPNGFDLVLTGAAEHPFEEFGDAHADLTGPCHIQSRARKLARMFHERGMVEKLPEGIEE